ncbi:MAG: four helix bundle protein [Saprospiraceae bacterium]|nr:four helix bundle protein [Saprospiraceae bacterium]
MAAVKRFEELIAWQKSQDLAVLIYDKFQKMKDFGFRDQICKAAISISNNIAEGFERNSNKDFARFLNIASGSCSETRSILYLAKKLNYINDNDQNVLLENGNEVSKIISGLRKAINK